ncbi:hypothetical protein QT711_03215 [Sporosarcina saromensis]|uniref:Uncharacterized protein n=1 Tax=Sporosarcina saromensis TaxID=359365 RepID=A0ABU4G791_9BACL|nr:hypothetical protein [Sporosarcina saromensis]MDW0112180.1 hypothetical protein [Sporosarcina saromensis]
MVVQLKEGYEMNVERVTYFYCYNPKLRKYLGLNGLRWGYKGFNQAIKKYYWTFEENEELSKLIEKYKIENANS